MREYEFYSKDKIDKGVLYSVAETNCYVETRIILGFELTSIQSAIEKYLSTLDIRNQLPDETIDATLEKILLDCACVSYPICLTPLLYDKPIKIAQQPLNTRGAVLGAFLDENFLHKEIQMECLERSMTDVFKEPLIAHNNIKDFRFYAITSKSCIIYKEKYTEQEIDTWVIQSVLAGTYPNKSFYSVNKTKEMIQSSIEEYFNKKREYTQKLSVWYANLGADYDTEYEKGAFYLSKTAKCLHIFLYLGEASGEHKWASIRYVRDTSELTFFDEYYSLVSDLKGNTHFLNNLLNKHRITQGTKRVHKLDGIKMKEEQLLYNSVMFYLEQHGIDHLWKKS